MEKSFIAANDVIGERSKNEYLDELLFGRWRTEMPSAKPMVLPGTGNFVPSVT